MKLSEKLEKLEVGKYYYTAEYNSYRKEEKPLRKSWWKVSKKNDKGIIFNLISTFNEQPLNYYSHFYVDAQEIFYKDHEWQEITESEFIAQVEELKSQLNKLITNN